MLGRIDKPRFLIFSMALFKIIYEGAWLLMLLSIVVFGIMEVRNIMNVDVIRRDNADKIIFFSLILNMLVLSTIK